MSNFTAMTRATDLAINDGVDERFKEWQLAEWLDDYFGPHQYGIRFNGDTTVRVDNGDFIYNKKMRAGTGYRALHMWVERRLGKPKECWECGDTTKSKYAWANKSGEYKRDLSDWERLCYSCHQKKDGFGFKRGYGVRGTNKHFCKRQHKLEGDNLYIKPNGIRECRACKKLFHSKEWIERNLTPTKENDRV